VVPPGIKKLEIFPKKPAAISDTWRKSLPIKGTTEGVDVMVLFYPNLKLIGSIDNTGSPNGGTWSKATTKGFTFSTTQTIDVTVSAAAGIVFVSAGVAVKIGVSFTESWNSSETITFGMTVPAGQVGFLYQGTLRCQVLRFDPKTGTFSYVGPVGTYLTDVSKSTNTPLELE
jgi:hypothetical protein